MKLFVTGVGGQLGFDVIKEALSRGYDCVGSDILENADIATEYVQLDITDKEAVSKVLHDVKPDVIVHCAAWTAVDLAEDEDKKPIVKAVNATGTENIALGCAGRENLFPSSTGKLCYAPQDIA